MMHYFRAGQAKEELNFQKKQRRKLARKSKQSNHSTTGAINLESSGLNFSQLEVKEKPKISDQRLYREPNQPTLVFFKSQGTNREKEQISPEEEWLPRDLEDPGGGDTLESL